MQNVAVWLCPAGDPWGRYVRAAGGGAGGGQQGVRGRHFVPIYMNANIVPKQGSSRAHSERQWSCTFGQVVTKTILQDVGFDACIFLCKRIAQPTWEPENRPLFLIP